MADKFEDLRTYATVVSCGGISAAAAEIGIAKSAVSRRISDLEARLGVSLIERTTRKFQLTAVGREYHRRALDVLGALERLDSDPSGRASSEVITVSARHDVLTHLIAPALVTFRERHPDVTLRLSSAGPADLAVVARSLGRKEKKVGSYLLVLCASPAYIERNGKPKAASELISHVGIQLADEPDWIAGGGTMRPPRQMFHAADADVAFALTVAGAGVAQLPDFVVAAAISDGRLVALLEDSEAPGSDLVFQVAEEASASVKALADHLSAELPSSR